MFLRSFVVFTPLCVYLTFTSILYPFEFLMSFAVLDYYVYSWSLRGNHSTLIRQRCDNILRWRMKLTFIKSERWLFKIWYAHGLSLIIVVLFSRYTDIETLFSFTSIIKKIIVCGRRYFEKPIDIVCWARMSSIQCGKVLCWPWNMIAYLTIQRFKGQIEKLCFSSTFSWRGNLVYRPIIALWTSLISM